MSESNFNHRGTETQSYAVTDAVIGAAIEVHRILGPGLFESAYEASMAEELRLRGIRFSRQVEIPLSYKGVALGQTYRADLVVDDQVLVELKSVEQFQQVHVSQVLTYLKLLNLPTGLLINFSVAQLKQGIKRVAL